MDYEKEYKKLKAGIKNAYLYAQTNSTKAVLEHILPELRESEDERVRNEIIAFVEQAIHRGGGTPIPQEQEDSWIAWLEKQRESQNEVRYWTEEEIEPIISDFLRGAEHYGGMIARLRYLKPKSLEAAKEEKVDNQNCVKDNYKPKFHEGDWISGYYANYRVTAINSKGYVVEDTDGNKINILFENEKFHHLFTIADAKNGDVLVIEEDGKPFIFRDCPDTNNPNGLVAYCGIDCANRLIISTDDQWWTDEKVCPATKGQRDTLERAITNAGYRWDEKKKELKKLGQQEVTKISFKAMPKIGGKYVQLRTENLLKQINSEVSITKRHHLINRYLNQREKQIENILANIEDDDIDLTLVVEQLWEDIQLAHKQIRHTIDSIDFYADHHALDKWDGKFNG